MKRAKTPKQISEQCERLGDELMFLSWDGKKYANVRYNTMFERVCERAEQYINNIYKIYGCDPCTASVFEVNYIWNNGRKTANEYEYAS